MTPMPRQSAMLTLDIPDMGWKVKVLRETMPKAYQAGLEAGIRGAVILIETAVKDLLDGPALNRRSGRLWKSVHGEVHSRMGRVIGIVGTNVKYAAVHEFGGVIRPKSADGWLMFEGGDGFVRVKDVNMPSRPFMSRAFKEQKAAAVGLIRTSIQAAANNALKTGKVLQVAQRRKVGFGAS